MITPEMITPELKDNLLSLLIKRGSFNDYVLIKDLSYEFSIELDVLGILLDQFQHLQLITSETTIGPRVKIFLTAYAFDLVRLGGFTAREELLKLNLKKLELEINALKKTVPEKAERISTIIANIASVVPLLFR